MIVLSNDVDEVLALLSGAFVVVLEAVLVLLDVKSEGVKFDAGASLIERSPLLAPVSVFSLSLRLCPPIFVLLSEEESEDSLHRLKALEEPAVGGSPRGVYWVPKSRVVGSSMTGVLVNVCSGESCAESCGCDCDDLTSMLLLTPGVSADLATVFGEN